MSTAPGAAAMKLDLALLPERAGTDGPVTYALVLQLLVDGKAFGEPRILQRGYRTPEEATEALLDCLTFAPPDLTVYDEATAQIAGMLDNLRDLNDALPVLLGRLSDLENSAPAPALPAERPNRFLQPGARPALPANPHAVDLPKPGPIRTPRPAMRTVISAGYGAGGRIRGGVPLEITGGVGRPGDLGPTGVGTGEDDPEAGEG